MFLRNSILINLKSIVYSRHSEFLMNEKEEVFVLPDGEKISYIREKKRSCRERYSDGIWRRGGGGIACGRVQRRSPDSQGPASSKIGSSVDFSWDRDSIKL